jgi:hypothetical protein
MKTFLRSAAAGLFLVLLGLSTVNAQGVSFVPGPAIAPSTSGGVAGPNGGFAWGDLLGNGNLDLFLPVNIEYLNTITAFTAAATTATAQVPVNSNETGLGLADFNGDGVPDLFTTNGGSPALLIDTAGVFKPATGIGDLATAGATGEVFQGMAAAPIDHSNYLSLAWPGSFTNIAAGSGPYGTNGGVWLLKGGASGFTDIGKGAASGNLAIDTTLSYESWDVRFFDANNDGYLDLLMPSFRNGFSSTGGGTSGARKASVLWINNGAGKFIIPTSATIPGNPTIYALDSIKVNKAGTMDSIEYASVHADTGIIVDDTVRHFTAIGEQWGDLNNDGIPDLVLDGLGATDNRDGNDSLKSDIILYGKGDGTFTYKFNSTVGVVPFNGLVQNTGQRAISIGDVNNDGWEDIYTCLNGGTQYLYMNNGNGTFTSTATSADGLVANGGRAGQLVDYNNDGFLDVFVYTGGTATLLKNNGNTNKWIGFKPIGTGHNMSAIGAKFTVWTAGKQQNRWITAEGGSAGQGGTLRALFGVGTATKVDSLQVLWPDGTSQSFNMGGITPTVPLNAYYTIQEGAKIPAAVTTIRPSWAKVDTALAPIDTLSWNAVSSGTGTTTYQVQIATNASFSTIAKTLSGLSTASTITQLGLSSKYYWRVQAFGNLVPGPYSAIDSFHTKTVVDTVTPKRLLPAANDSTVAYKPKLVVSYVSTASTYHFQVTVADSNFRNWDAKNGVAKSFVINDSTSDFDTTWAITTALTPSKTYYWRVRGYNPAGSSAWSPEDSFKIMFLPATPTLIHPSVNQANVPVNPLTLTWRHEAGDSNYVAQLWSYTSAGGQVLLVDTTKTKNDTSWTISSGLLNRAYYYWKVQCFNQGGASSFSAVDSFTSVIEVAGPPVAVSPKGTTTTAERKTLFEWNPAANAESYHLQVASASDFSGDIIVDTTTADTSIRIADTLAPSTTFYYRLSSINLGGEGGFSGATVFKTGTVVGVHEFTSTVPEVYALFQNYPNPFNPSTTISYDLPKSSYVKVVIYDVLGRQVATLVNGMQQASHQVVQWNPSALSSGVYFCRIEARSADGSGNFAAVKKLLYMK